MIKREHLIKKINALPDDSLGEVDKLINRLIKSKRVKVLSYSQNKSDSLMNVAGTCLGPDDLAERHDHYIYGSK
jgi:hypothetical protein